MVPKLIDLQNKLLHLQNILSKKDGHTSEGISILALKSLN